MKNKLSKIEKRMLIFEAIFVFGSFIYLFFSTSPSQLYPMQGMTISEADFNIEIQNGETVLISTDSEFTNPIVLSENSQVTLVPRLYYWKVKNKFRESGVKKFIVDSQVGLNIKDRIENYELENSGNVDLNVTKSKLGMTSSVSLEVGEIKKVEKDNSSYEGGQI